MNVIKNFIYLDEYKMYSLSSQVFEGITEYLVNFQHENTQEHESQKGPISSGRVVADILSKGRQTEEKRLLHDYSYHVSEKHLLEQGVVLTVDKNVIENMEKAINDHSFIKVKAKAIFNDINSIKETLSNFNKIGEYLTYVTNFSNIQEIQKQAEALQNTIKDKNQKASLASKSKSLMNITKLAKESGLHHDEKYLEALDYLLTYGYQDQFEVQLASNDLIFSANLKRTTLREPESLLIRKYSRITEKEFVIFGVVTQNAAASEEKEERDIKEKTNIKEVLLSLITYLSDVEHKFTGKLSNEIIIDPIAVYTEL